MIAQGAHLLRIISLRATVLLTCFCPGQMAWAEAATPIAVANKFSSSVLFYRDINNRKKYYFIPAKLALSEGENGRPLLGVQIFSEDEKVWKAAITLTLRLQIGAADLEEIAADLGQKSELQITALGVRYRLSNFVRVKDTEKIVISNLANGNSTADTNIATTFEISGTKEFLFGMLSGASGELGLVLEYKPQISIARLHDITMSGPKLAKLFTAKTSLSTLEYRLGGNDFIKNIISTFSGGEILNEGALRQWLEKFLGAPSIHGDIANRYYGWDLASERYLKALDTGGDILISWVDAQEPEESHAAVLTLSDLCAKNPQAIVNLNDGSTGCQ